MQDQSTEEALSSRCQGTFQTEGRLALAWLINGLVTATQQGASRGFNNHLELTCGGQPVYIIG